MQFLLSLNRWMDLIQFEFDCLCCTFVLYPTSGIPLILLSLHQVSLIVHLCPSITHLSFLFSPLQTQQKIKFKDIQATVDREVLPDQSLHIQSTHTTTTLNIDNYICMPCIFNHSQYSSSQGKQRLTDTCTVNKCMASWHNVKELTALF